MNTTYLDNVAAAYLDNAATSFPKPDSVAEAVNEYITRVGASINRSVYEKAQEAEMVTYNLRESLSGLFHHDEPRNVVITPGNTYGLNMVIKGFLKPGDHVLVSSMEHNAVMRPIIQLHKTGVEFDRIPCDKNGIIIFDEFIKMFKANTRLVIVCHASNVGGGIQDIYSIGRICNERDVAFVVDAAQTAGHIPIDFKQAYLSAMTVPGHKGLMGPQGIGALLMTSEFAEKLDPIISGGTGSASDSEEVPSYMPDKFESGTANLPGIYGFEAAVRFVENTGIDALMEHDRKLSDCFIKGIRKLQEKYGETAVRLVGPDCIEQRVGVISLDFGGMDNAEVSFRLEDEFGIMTRCGMHCAPSAHKTLGTFPQGVVRFSHGWFNTTEDICKALDAVSKIINKGNI